MKKEVAKALLDIKAVSLSPSNPYTWASGIKSPIYCDNRLTLSYPKVRNLIEDGLTKIVKNEYPECEMIFGTATAGIAHAALVAERLDLPMGYVRSSSKAHGKQNQIEGRVIPGSKVVVIEDLISTGGSSVKVVETLKEEGLEVLGVVAIFSYNLPAAIQTFEQAEVDYKTLSDYDTLVEVAVDTNYVTKLELNKLKQWKKDPKDENWMK